MIIRETVVETVGKTFADKLDELIFYVSDNFSFTRRQMVEELGCANFIAAAKLAKALKRHKISTIGQLYKTDPFSLYRLKGIGDTAIFVAMCILASKEYDPRAWFGIKGEEKEKSIRRAKRNKQGE